MIRENNKKENSSIRTLPKCFLRQDMAGMKLQAESVGIKE